jgi:lipid A 3-O-deacylase
MGLVSSHWREPSFKHGHCDYAQFGAITTLRYRFDGGNSPWFAEAGLGATGMNHNLPCA